MSVASACGSKRRYTTYELAVAAAVRCIGNMKFPPDTMQPYACRSCRGFHLTSHPRRNELKRFPAIEAQK